MQRAYVSATKIAADSWRLGIQSWTILPKLFASALVLLILVEAVQRFGFNLEPPRRGLIWNATASLSGTIATSLLFASVLVAVHRLVLKGDTTDRPVWRLPACYWRFFAWFLLINLAWLLGPFVGIVITADHELVGSVLNFLVVLVAMILSLRILLLFPAVAAEMPDATLHNALRDSRGHLWRFFGVTFVAALPFTVTIVIATFAIARFGLIEDSEPSSMPLAIILLAIDSAIRLVMVAVLAVVASRLFQAYGERLP
jgi:hypothetical protein